MSKLSKRLPDDIILRGSKDNLERGFRLVYRDLPKVQPIVAQIGGSHNLNIFKRVQTKFAVKAEYTFDFLEMGEDLNTVAATLAATIKKNFVEVNV